jgi:hypothetical protein
MYRLEPQAMGEPLRGVSGRLTQAETPGGLAGLLARPQRTVRLRTALVCWTGHLWAN